MHAAAAKEACEYATFEGGIENEKTRRRKERKRIARNWLVAGRVAV